ncbi:hypothetical protein [Reyranella sp.]|uniref:hypothetical protein n=1 Tax=Reyranella sp. TaxID=1929291 RepID=UPI003D0D8CF8
MRNLGIAALCAALAGCAGGDKPETVASAALNFDEMKAVILAERSRIWKDTESIRDAAIGNPYTCSGGLAHVGQMPNVCVCVAANARNSFGGYTGIRRTEILMAGRQIVDLISPPREPTYSCGPLTPFPELNGNYVAPAAVPQPTRAKRSPAT